MKKAAAAALLAVLLLSGCSFDKKGRVSADKPEAKTYTDDSSQAHEVKEFYAEGEGDEPGADGEPLCYGDFMLSDFNFISKYVGEDQRMFTYAYRSAYDEDGEWTKRINYFGRMKGFDTPQEMADEYGSEVSPMDFGSDKIWQYAVLLEDQKISNAYDHAVCYVDAKYELPEGTASLGYYTGLRFYFDEKDQVVLQVVYLNDDMMPLDKVYYHDYYTGVDFGFVMPEGHTLTSKMMLYGMTNFGRLYKDVPYPVFTFDDSQVRIEWKHADGSPAEGVGVLKDVESTGYSINGTSIDLDLPEGGDNMETYIAYNSFLDAYEFHDPYYRDELGCTVLLYREQF